MSVFIYDPLMDNKSNGSSSGDSSIPSGLIAIWSGAADNIPEGWHLYDGTDGLPILKDSLCYIIKL